MSWFQTLLSKWVNLCRYAAFPDGRDKLLNFVVTIKPDEVGAGCTSLMQLTHSLKR
jgi:hypothetical protein